MQQIRPLALFVYLEHRRWRVANMHAVNYVPKTTEKDAHMIAMTIEC